MKGRGEWEVWGLRRYKLMWHLYNIHWKASLRQKKISKTKQGVPKNALYGSHWDSVLEMYVIFLIDGHQPEVCRTKIKEIMTV